MAINLFVKMPTSYSFPNKYSILGTNSKEITKEQIRQPDSPIKISSQ